MARETSVCGRLPAVMAALLLFVAGGIGEIHALERAVAPAPDRAGGGDSWRESTQVTLSYYNLCTGWTWVWDTWFRRSDSYGVLWEAPEGASTLLGHWEFTAYDVFARGYTGTLRIWEVSEDDQLGPVVASQGYYPQAGWSWYPWNIPVPESGRFLIGARGPSNGTYRPGLVTEFAGTGPDGEGPACGTCYPPGRETRSRYSLSSSVPWPGQKFNSGDVCDSELLWDAVFSTLATGVEAGVESTTWSRLRAMFR